MTSGSSGWLADQFVDKAGKPDRPDGIVNYESVLLGLNAEGKLKDSLSVVVPSDGVVTANPGEARAGAAEGARDADRRRTDRSRGQQSGQGLQGDSCLSVKDFILDYLGSTPTLVGSSLGLARWPSPPAQA
jgi:hypothetical protein